MKYIHRMKGFRQFLDDVSKYPRLSPERELQLIPLAQSGDQTALDELVLGNMRLVLLIVRRFVRRSGISMEDLVSHGSMGLLKAIQRFDINLGDNLGQYAKFWIEKEICIAISEQGHPVSIPASQGSRIAKMYRATEQLRHELKREPTMEEIQTSLQISRTAHDTIRWVSTVQISLHEAKPSGYTFEDELYQDTPNLDEVLIEQERNDALQRALATLSPREEKLMRLSNGFEEPESMTITDIAQKLKISRNRASDLREVALCKLRSEIRWAGVEGVSG